MATAARVRDRPFCMRRGANVTMLHFMTRDSLIQLELEVAVHVADTYDAVLRLIITEAMIFLLNHNLILI